MSDGWNESAAAWVAHLGEKGDFGRVAVLDTPMLGRVRALAPQTALDVGCGEGRFCRMLRAQGVAAVGIDPTAALLAEARRRDPAGDYREGRAEALAFPDASFDLVVSYLSLIDIASWRAAVAEMARVLKPAGALLVANLTSFSTASAFESWVVDADGVERFPIDRYLEESARFIAWNGIRILNHHRPLSAYMQTFLAEGLTLSHFDEPRANPDIDAPRAARFDRVPWFVLMEWRKPC